MIFKVLEVSKNTNLEQFSRLLWQKRLSHRIIKEAELQFLLVSNQQDIHPVLELYRQWQQGEIQPDSEDSGNVAVWFKPGAMISDLLLAFLRAPLTLFLIAVCVMLAFIAPLDSFNETVRAMLYPDFSYGTRTINLTTVLTNFSVVQFLKMLSPILLHAGIVHLAFNMLWLWELGRRIEAVQASWVFFLVIIVIALVSNTGQYLFGGGNNFGGMSGVVYGLFAYIWMWQLFDPAKKLGLPGSLILFMLLSLAIMTFIGLESIADTAHVGGFLCGMLAGAILATISRIQRSITTT